MGVFLWIGNDMKRVDISRRALIATLLKSTAAALTVRYWISAASAESTLSLKLPEPGSAEAPLFEVFLALSQLVTLRPHLDEMLARRMYPLFLDEPWGAHHIHSTYAQLLGLIELSDGQLKPLPPLLKDGLGKGQAWFAGHLLTTWYLGIYYHARMPPMRVAYAEALMFDAVSPMLPNRFVGGTGFGVWGNPASTRNCS